MKYLKILFCFILAMFLSSTSSFAIEGKIIKKECPFNCKKAGIEKKYCREWQKDGKCFIEDKSPRIYIQKKKCPFSCKTLHLPKRECKDYKEGGLCVVERLIGLKF